MKVWLNDNPTMTEPEGHFGGLASTDIIPFKGRNFAFQKANVPPGGGGLSHSHDEWAQVFYIAEGQMTFDTGEERFVLTAGQSVLFEPHEPHGTINEGASDATVLVITVEQG